MIEERPRLDLPIDLTNSRETGFDELLRADNAVADQARRLGRGQQMQIRQIHLTTLLVQVVQMVPIVQNVLNGLDFLNALHFM